MAYKVDTIREKFPLLQQEDGAVYLDSAATTQKPLEVLQAIRDYYVNDNANIHRGSHLLARHAEGKVAQVRSQVQAFIHARTCEEIIFTSGTTDGLNMVAQTYGNTHLQEGDEVVVSVMEHHSNFLPWQRLCEAKKAHLRIVSLLPTGHIDLAELKKVLSPRTKIVAVSYASNVLGTVNPVQAICALAHEQGAVVVVDAAQAVAHLPIDVQALDCDFLAFSAHKAYGPTGIGVLYGKEHLLATMDPYKVGGGMIQRLSVNEAPLYETPPYRFEAGTPHIAGIIGLGATLHFLQSIGFENIRDHEAKLISYAHAELSQLPTLQWVGNLITEIGIMTFNFEGIHPLDIGLRLDAAHIAVRTGAFCAKPLMDYLQVQGAIRVSLGVYNTRRDIDQLIKTLKWIIGSSKS